MMNKGMKCFYFLIFLFVLLLGGCSAKSEPTIHADYPYYDSLEALVVAADIIVEGRIMSSAVEMLDISNRTSALSSNGIQSLHDRRSSELTPYTVFNVQVTHGYKGILAHTETIRIKQIGGKVNGNKKVHPEGSADLKIGNTYLLLLESYEDVPASLVNPIQGAYVILENQYLGHSENEIMLDKPSLINSLNFQ